MYGYERYSFEFLDVIKEISTKKETPREVEVDGGNTLCS